MRTVVAAGTVTDFSLRQKSSAAIDATRVLLSFDQPPIECGCLRA